MIFNPDPFKKIQSNQFSTGQTSDPNMQTSWMGAGGFQPSQQQAPKSFPMGQSTPSTVNNGTAVDRAFTGGFNGNTGITGGGSDWTQIPNQQPSQGGAVTPIQYGSYTGQAGWDSAKLNDPNKHDPKYDWLRAVQSVGGNQDMNKVTDYYNKNFGGNAKFLGTDKVDFGGNTGIIDTLFDQEGSRQNLWAPLNSNSGNNPAISNNQQGAQNQPQFLQGLMQMIQQMMGQQQKPGFNWQQIGNGSIPQQFNNQPQYDSFLNPNSNQPGMNI